VTASQRLRERRERHKRRPFHIRALVFLGGVAAVAGGVALLVLPGPGIPLLAAGLALLALEFEWADRLLSRVLRHAARVAPASRGKRAALGILTLAGLVAATVVVSIWGIPGL
jgi:uncharacterized protein (TIGR02611 family)